MKGGLPENIDEYSVSAVNELKIYVPNNMCFADDVAKIVDFKKRNGLVDVGVSNVKENE